MTLHPRGALTTAMTPTASTHTTRTTKHLKIKRSVAHVKTLLLLLEVEMAEVEMVEVVEEEMVAAGVARSRWLGWAIFID